MNKFRTVKFFSYKKQLAFNTHQKCILIENLKKYNFYSREVMSNAPQQGEYTRLPRMTFKAKKNPHLISWAEKKTLSLNSSWFWFQFQLFWKVEVFLCPKKLKYLIFFPFGRPSREACTPIKCPKLTTWRAVGEKLP